MCCSVFILLPNLYYFYLSLLLSDLSFCSPSFSRIHTLAWRRENALWIADLLGCAQKAFAKASIWKRLDRPGVRSPRNRRRSRPYTFQTREVADECVAGRVCSLEPCLLVSWQRPMRDDKVISPASRWAFVRCVCTLCGLLSSVARLWGSQCSLNATESRRKIEKGFVVTMRWHP